MPQAGVFVRFRKNFYRKSYMKLTSHSHLFASLFMVGILAGCGGSGSEGSSSTSSSGGSSSSSAANCKYDDKVTPGERELANSCGIQVSAGYGAADARLQQIIQACQSGQKSAADTDYSGP